MPVIAMTANGLFRYFRANFIRQPFVVLMDTFVTSRGVMEPSSAFRLSLPPHWEAGLRAEARADAFRSSAGRIGASL